MDRFEDMITETDRIKLAENLKYSMGFQILERSENSKNINSVERMRLRDVLEDVNGNPRAKKTLELMKKDLRT